MGSKEADATERLNTRLERGERPPEHPSTAALNFEHPCLSWIYSVPPLARCVLNKVLLHFTSFQLRKDFIETLYFCKAGEACIYLIIVTIFKDLTMSSLRSNELKKQNQTKQKHRFSENEVQNFYFSVRLIILVQHT